MNQQSKPLGHSFPTLIHMLKWRALHQPDELAYVFLVNGEDEEVRITYGELDRKARAIADGLQARQAAAQPVLLLYPSGLDFIEAFFGVLYAGAIAVPLYPPRRNRPDERLDSIIRDSGARLFLTDRKGLNDLPRVMAHTPVLNGLQGWSTDDLDPAQATAREAAVTPHDLAFLQYTSGSTHEPKGVMVSHSNLMSNLERIKQSCAQPAMRVVGWLPMFHDMGLIANTLEPFYIGSTLVFMSPTHFLQRPVRWLKAISRYRATTSGGPNFAYDLCVEKVTPQEREGLDLSHWGVAFNGAEPVRLETLDRFAAAFAANGFRREAFFPCYGLAEATILVASAPRDRRPVSLTLDKSELGCGKVRPMAPGALGARESVVSVGCGQIADEESVVIVNPHTLADCGPDEVGEVWVASDSVTHGYWKRPEETAACFGAKLEGRANSFLRTGDLGFVRDNELFITGRLKDLIVLRGRNYYPQDIENAAEAAHEAVAAGCSAAFSHDLDGQELLVVVFEVERKHLRRLDLDAVFAAVQTRILLDVEVRPAAMYALKSGTIPKTTSGKIRRRACKQDYLAEGLEVLGAWRDNEMVEPSDQALQPAGLPVAESRPPVRKWLAAQVAQYLGRRPSDIDIHRPFAEYGVDSVTAVQLSGDLEAWLGRRLPPTLLYECPTIDLLAVHLEDGVAAHALTSGAAPRPEASSTESIAIVGMACRFPGAPDIAAFWKLLCDQVDAITEVPSERWDANAFYDPMLGRPGKMNTRWGGFLPDVDLFDAGHFQISRREAMCMDPQQRLLLELAQESLEDAGMPAARLRGTRTGVFIGICNSDYAALLSDSGSAIDPRWATGNAFSIAANRISYTFDFKGPSLAVDTACSSSLVSVHLACQSLWSGESTLALAGGVNLILRPDVTLSFSAAGGTSPEGRCKAFGARADGMVRSEGAGLVILKRLSDAIIDGDSIYAVIPGSAVNHDGLSNGLTAPNQGAQEAVIRSALARAGRRPQDVQYVEAHGTGTLLGDPIEANALGNVLSSGRPSDAPCGLGSVKSNIGHTEAAAGIASLIKVALALKHAHIPASLHCERQNPHIAFEALGLRAQQAPGAWRDNGGPALAGVSAFGFGGTNAHVLMEQAPFLGRTAEASATASAVQLLPISARTPAGLRDLAKAYLDQLEKASSEPVDLGDLCRTAALGRDHMACRLGIVFTDIGELRDRLRAFAVGQSLAGMFHAPDRPAGGSTIAFVFSGHRGQGWSVSRDFLDSQSVFRAALHQCEDAFRPYADWSLTDVLLAEGGHGLDPQRVDIYHPCQFAYQVALAALWRSLGVVPTSIVGHSFGEVAAAHVAGALSLPDAVQVIFSRSRCLQGRADGATDRGAMAVVELPRQEVQALLEAYAPSVSIAVNNSPSSVVLSGSTPDITRFVETLKSRQIFCNLLNSPGSGHQYDIDTADVVRELQAIRPQAAQVTLISSVLGHVVDGREMDADYWAKNIQQTVLFADAAGALAERGCDTFIEVAPYPPVLSYAVSQCVRSLQRAALTLPVLRRNASEQMHLYGVLGALYAQGLDPAWERIHPRAARRHTPVPGHPWQRERFWLAPGPRHRAAHQLPGSHPLLSLSVQPAVHPEARFWEVTLSVALHPFLADHRVQGAVILPTTAYLEMGLEAGRQVFGPEPCRLQNLVLDKALFLAESETRTLQLVWALDAPDRASIRFFSRPAQAAAGQVWTPHARLEVLSGQALPAPHSDFSPATVAMAYPVPVTGGAHYQALRDKGIDYGPVFQGMERLWLRELEAVGAIRLPEAETSRGYLLHPALLDACLQVLAGQLQVHEGVLSRNDLFLPVGVEALIVHEWPAADAPLWSRARLRSTPTSSTTRMEGDVQVLDNEGRVLVEVQALVLEKVGSGKAAVYRNAEACLYDLRWEPVARATASAGAVSPPPALWVVFSDGVVGPELARLLRERRNGCVLVLPGGLFEFTAPDQCVLSPGVRADHDSLAARLMARAQGGQIHIAHLWGLSLKDPANAGAWEDEVDLGCVSVLLFLQAMTAAGPTRGMHLSIVTRQGQSVGGEPVVALQSAAWGLGKVIGFEHPEVGCSLVDVSAETGRADAPALLDELLVVAGGLQQVALRPQGRYEARLGRLAISGALATPALGPLMKADATYLVTGGLGGIGLTVASWMAEHGARHLVLMGRRGASLAAQEAIGRLEAAGVRVRVAQADVADEAQVARVMAEIAAVMPPLRGIAHAAGVVDPDLLRNLDAARFKSVMAPKVGGAINLHRQTAALPLDFFVMFSSVASLFGTPGQGNYVAANAFLDGLAHQRQSAGLPALSINWGGWSEVGLVAQRAGASDLFALRGFDSLPSEQALALLEALMREGRPQAAAMSVHWSQVRVAYPQLEAMPLFSQLLAAEAGSRATERPGLAALSHAELRDMPEAERLQWLRHYLGFQLAMAFGVAAHEVDFQQPINTMGIDSLMALEVKNRVETELKITLPIVKFLEGANVSEIAAQLLQDLEKAEAAACAPASASEPTDDGPLDTARAAQLLADVDEMPDEAVEALLASLELSESKA